METRKVRKKKDKEKEDNPALQGRIFHISGKKHLPKKKKR
jgi:hypothetical protein